MNYKKITLRKDNGEIIEFHPERIGDIVFEKDTVTISFYGEWFTTVLKKEDYYYPHWEYFILQLTRIFEIDRFEIEGE